MKELNLTQILKNCPIGTKLYSPLFGEVEFDGIRDGYNYPIRVSTDKEHFEFSEEGKYLWYYEDGECLLFPSKKQRDWSKFKISKPDLPVDTPVMVKSDPDIMWYFRYYAGNGCTWKDGYKTADDVNKVLWDYIIPFDKFNPDNIEDSIKNFNYGTKQD